MTIELDALLLCLQSIDCEEKNEQLSQLIATLDNWDHFIELVRYHRVIPLVYKVLCEQYTQQIPATVMNSLKTYRDANTIHVMKLTAEILRIGGILQTQGIPFISFKGSLLAQRLYGDLTARQPRDLDFLIPETHFLKTHKLLLQHGYQLHSRKKLPNNMPLFSRYQKDISYFHPTKKIVLELHWRLFNNRHEFTYPLTQLFQNNETDVLSGVSFTRMPAEIEFIYLIAHGCEHSWKHLFWLCDIKQYIQKLAASNWSKLLVLAKEMKTERPFLEGLYLANQLLQVPIDPIIENQIRHNKRVQSIARVSTLLIKHSNRPTLWIRSKMLLSRFQKGSPSLPFYREYCERVMIRLLRII